MEKEPAEVADEAGGSESAIVEASLFRIVWQDVTPHEDTNLSDAVTTVALTNGSDSEAALVLRLVGDYGTTRTEIVELGETVVPAATTVVVPVDLSAIYSGKTMDYAGRAHISAYVMKDGIAHEHVVGNALFYHPGSDGIVTYDEARLMKAHASGDILNLVPEVLSSEDPEDQATVRIVKFEPEDVEPANGEPFLAEQEAVSQKDRSQLIAPSAAGSTYAQKLCVRFQVQTVDSGFQSANGVTEDVWANANEPVLHKANYARVKIGGVTYEANSSGCVQFFTPGATAVETVRVWARADDADGNYVRVHNGSPSTTDSYPGTTYSWVETYVGFNTGVTTVLPVGSYSERATMMGALARSLHRYSDGLQNTEIHVAEDPATNGLNYNYFNDYLNDEAYISIRTQGGQRRTKFLVAHEYGHAYLHQMANTGAANDPGGHMVNTCCQGSTSCTPAADGHGVIFDWMRALWDMHDGGGGCSLDRWDMMAFFGVVVGASPAQDEYYSVSETMSAWFGGSCVNWWAELACHNGINMDGSTWSQPC